MTHMLSHEQYQNVVANCILRFAKLHPDCGFGLNSFDVRIVEPDGFIDAILSAPSSAPVSREECVRNHNGDDAILIRKEEKSTIILKHLPSKSLAMLFISVYHELAHAYALNLETKSGYDAANRIAQKSSPDMLPGYLFWKEFTADYLAYDALHHDIERIPATDKAGVDAMAELMPKMCDNMITPTLSAFSALANACAIIMNFDGFHEALCRDRLITPINRRKRSGRELHRMFMELLLLLSDRMQSADPYAITDDFLNRLGFIVMEVQLFHEDYSDDTGW